MVKKKKKKTTQVMKMFKSMDDCDVQLSNHKENMTTFISYYMEFLPFYSKKWYSLDKGLRVIYIFLFALLGG